MRASFFGGGTDLPAWFMENGGAVLATAINKYIYLHIRYLPPIFDYNYRVAWTKMETVDTCDEIQHPVVREALKHYWPDHNCGFDIVYNADLPARSGLGSSSAFTVGFLQALSAMRGKMISNRELAHEAIFVEQQLLKENVGCQDQITTALGGFNRIDFLPGGGWRVTPVTMPLSRRNELEDHIMMFFTGFMRSASAIEAQKIENIGKKQQQLRRMHAMVSEAQEILMSSGDMVFDFASLLDEAWQLKRELASSVSTSNIDDAYRAAIQAGAWGGKLLGAGGGGFMMFLVPPDRREAVRQALAELVEVPIKMESEGSRVVLYDPSLSNNYGISSPAARKGRAAA
ncbi:MAG TPA: kinase [Alphaproteobacteria bacterium]|nr:kinase [Alphaproteobacteria bacterium]